MKLTYPRLPFKNAYYAVIDIEALVLKATQTRVVNIVEQAAIILVDINGYEVFAAKYMIYQPKDLMEISNEYTIPYKTVVGSALAYTTITADNYLHNNKNNYLEWFAIRNHIKRICKDYAAKVYAKGTLLENSVFYGEIVFHDLAMWGCPRFPYEIHDPLAECRYFARYIPELNYMLFM
jgi:hypothetical protein